jgi:hypothetical protein
MADFDFFKNFKNPYDIDGEIAKKILNKDQILGNVSDISEETLQIDSGCIYIVNVDDIENSDIGMIAKNADRYFYLLDVPIRTIIFRKNWKLFDFNNVGNSEGVCLLGEPQNIKRFLFQKYYVKYNIMDSADPKYINSEGMPHNFTNAMSDNHQFKYLWKVEALEKNNPESSTGGGDYNLDTSNKNINIVSIYPQGAKEFSNNELNLENSHIEFMAFSLVHGVGHNSLIRYMNENITHTYKGIMMDGKSLIDFVKTTKIQNKNIFNMIISSEYYPFLEKLGMELYNEQYKNAVKKRFLEGKRVENKY